jgi:hypothetical protein
MTRIGRTRGLRDRRRARPPLTLAGLEGRLRKKLDDWRWLLQRNVEDARAVRLESGPEGGVEARP